jgi:hypothetical protein
MLQTIGGNAMRFNMAFPYLGKLERESPQNLSRI